MNPRNIKPLKNHSSYFIHINGFVFKVMNGKDYIIEPEIIEETKTVYVLIDGEKKNLLYLMIENFMPSIKYTENVSFNLQYGKNIPLTAIKVHPEVIKHSVELDNIIAKYKCTEKANSANSRSQLNITPAIVAHCLVNVGFKCYYCDRKLIPINWHLDHYIPISKGGLNRIDNLAPSCSMCNTMKSNFYYPDLVKQCKLIIEKSYKNLE